MSIRSFIFALIAAQAIAQDSPEADQHGSDQVAATNATVANATAPINATAAINETANATASPAFYAIKVFTGVICSVDATNATVNATAPINATAAINETATANASVAMQIQAVDVAKDCYKLTDKQFINAKDIGGKPLVSLFNGSDCSQGTFVGQQVLLCDVCLPAPGNGTKVSFQVECGSQTVNVTHVANANNNPNAASVSTVASGAIFMAAGVFALLF